MEVAFFHDFRQFGGKLESDTAALKAAVNERPEAVSVYRGEGVWRGGEYVPPTAGDGSMPSCATAGGVCAGFATGKLQCRQSNDAAAKETASFALKSGEITCERHTHSQTCDVWLFRAATEAFQPINDRLEGIRSQLSALKSLYIGSGDCLVPDTTTVSRRLSSSRDGCLLHRRCFHSLQVFRAATNLITAQEAAVAEVSAALYAVRWCAGVSVKGPHGGLFVAGNSTAISRRKCRPPRNRRRPQTPLRKTMCRPLRGTPPGSGWKRTMQQRTCHPLPLPTCRGTSLTPTATTATRWRLYNPAPLRSRLLFNLVLKKPTKMRLLGACALPTRAHSLPSPAPLTPLTSIRRLSDFGISVATQRELATMPGPVSPTPQLKQSSHAGAGAGAGAAATSHSTPTASGAVAMATPPVPQSSYGTPSSELSFQSSPPTPRGMLTTAVTPATNRTRLVTTETTPKSPSLPTTHVNLAGPTPNVG